MKWKLVYVLFGEHPQEVIKYYDEILEMIANIEQGKILKVEQV